MYFLNLGVKVFNHDVSFSTDVLLRFVENAMILL